MSAFVVAAEALVRDLHAAKHRAEFQVIEGGGRDWAVCTKPGPCPCDAPCAWSPGGSPSLRLVEGTPRA
jgi:hypothetical protein